MEAIFERLSSGQIVAVLSILAGVIVAIAIILAISKYKLQSLAEDTALRRERQKADLALRELLVERRTAAGEKLDPDELLAIVASEPEADDVNAELAKRFGRLETDAAAIEDALLRVMAAGSVNKKLVLGVMDELLESGAQPEVILAAVRPLCGVAKDRPRPVEHAV
ncbi:MAG: hypothetical protein J0I06_23960 [Planctomycetes bacterium]|nr:hypothetical protein [Planctomycetota bacterium]